jgi:hypothetical protein
VELVLQAWCVLKVEGGWACCAGLDERVGGCGACLALSCEVKKRSFVTSLSHFTYHVVECVVDSLRLELPLPVSLQHA